MSNPDRTTRLVFADQVDDGTVIIVQGCRGYGGSCPVGEEHDAADHELTVVGHRTNDTALSAIAVAEDGSQVTYTRRLIETVLVAVDVPASAER